MRDDRPGATRRATLLTGALLLLAPPLAAAAEPLEEERWQPLRRQLFGDRPIHEGLVQVTAPTRADDAALVPIAVSVPRPLAASPRVTSIHVFVDWNPDPLVGVFRFTPDSGIASIATRIRIQTKSPVRAVAETSDGALYMDAKVVKAAGGCSAPVGRSDQEAKRLAGQMRFRTEGEVRAGQPVRAQLLIRHPQYNGLQRDVITGGTPPPDFIRRVTVRHGDAVVLDAETTFAISANPSLHFYFVPGRARSVTVRAEDTRDRVFEQSFPVVPGGA